MRPLLQQVPRQLHGFQMLRGEQQLLGMLQGIVVAQRGGLHES